MRKRSTPIKKVVVEDIQDSNSEVKDATPAYESHDKPIESMIATHHEKPINILPIDQS